METVKVFLNDKQEGELACPQCGKKRLIDLNSHQLSTKNISLDKFLKVKCSCNHLFRVAFEYRKYHRAPVNLSGKLLDPNSKQPIDDIRIKSLSVGSVGFTTNNKTVVKKGDIYEIIFTLDDVYHSTICEEIIIRRIHNEYIGAEFYHGDRYNHDLDFYIMETR